MSGRSCLAFVATPLLGLLAALLLGWSVAAAQAPDPLTLTVTAERAECTAGTLNPVTWEISGGTPPYTLTIDDTPVDADAESATVLCRALPYGATEAPATFMVFVTDAGGTTVTARAAYTIVPPFHGPLFSERAAGVEPLSLALTAMRAECTAGTLNPVVWTITGGTPPDTLTVDGEPVDADAERTTGTCGRLPAGATEASGTITARVTDAAGTTVTARAAYTIVPPLPPPTEVYGGTNYTFSLVDWNTWDDGEVGDPYLVRWRAIAPDTRTTDLWTTALRVVGASGAPYIPLPLSSTYEVAVAKARDRIERETPEALLWSAPVLITTYSPPPPPPPLTGFEASATHDTITVTVNWDPPPWAEGIRMKLRGPRHLGERGFLGEREFTIGGGIPDQVVFRHLPPDTAYTLYAIALPEPSASEPSTAVIDVSTAAPPTEWRPLPRGPQNLRTAVTHESLTADWDAPYADADDVYEVLLLQHRIDGSGAYVTVSGRVTVSGGVTTHTFAGLDPATPYRLVVTHSDIVSASVGGRSVRGEIRTQARPGPPLRLTLSVERAECPAGAFTPVRWTFTGGTPPYTLTVAGEPVPTDEGAATVRCGGLRADGQPVPETIAAHVTDATGAMATAAGTYVIVPPVAVPLPSERAAGVEPLALTLTVERSECTAGTRNRVTWTITGGTPPDTLTIDGEPVSADAADTTVTCGDLPEGASEAPGTITASVTDAAGTTAMASAAYTIVPPLPAPTGLSLGPVHADRVGFDWDAVDGAGSQSLPVRYYNGRRDYFDSYLFRYRPSGAEATAPYEFVGPVTPPFISVWPGPRDAVLMPATTGDYLGMVAAIRHTIEQETPAALHWSAPVPFGVARAPENIVVQATPDTLDVSWDEQHTYCGGVWLVGGGVHLSRNIGGTTIADGRHHARFQHLTPETEYEIEIRVCDGSEGSADGGLVIGDGVSVEEIATQVVLTVRTLPAPADWQPLPEGPQNLRATATHDSITLRWDPPFPEASPHWFVSVTTIVDGTTWSVRRMRTRTPLPEGLTLDDAHPWLIRPNTTYRILVRHDGWDGSGAEISVTTPAAPPTLPTCFDYGVGPVICT